jgi:hypothetical protein
MTVTQPRARPAEPTRTLPRNLACSVSQFRRSGPSRLRVVRPSSATHNSTRIRQVAIPPDSGARSLYRLTTPPRYKRRKLFRVAIAPGCALKFCGRRRVGVNLRAAGRELVEETCHSLLRHGAGPGESEHATRPNRGASSTRWKCPNSCRTTPRSRADRTASRGSPQDARDALVADLMAFGYISWRAYRGGVETGEP